MSFHRSCCCDNELDPDELGKCCVPGWIDTGPQEIVVDGDLQVFAYGISNCFDVTRAGCDAVEGGVFTAGEACVITILPGSGYIRSCDPLSNGPGPGPGGPTPRPEPPDPDDPDISICLPCPSGTGCTNWWLPEHVTGGVLDADKRVVVRMVIEIGVRVFGERKLSDGTVLGEYDSTYILTETLDSGTDGSFCTATVFDFAFLTETVGGEEFDISWFGEVSWNTDDGFTATFSLDLQSTGSAFTGGGGSHAVEFAATSDTTITDGLIARANSSGGSDFDEAAVTVPMGDCQLSFEGAWSGVSAEYSSGGPPTETLLRTDVLFVRAHLVVGNVLPCGVFA